MSKRFEANFVRQWSMSTNGIRIAKCLVFPFTRRHGRCIVASRDIEPQEELIVIPPQCMLQSVDAEELFPRASVIVREVVRDQADCDDDAEYWLLALMLAIERRKGASSKYYAYLKYCLAPLSASSIASVPDGCLRPGNVERPSYLSRCAAEIFPTISSPTEKLAILRGVVLSELQRQSSMSKLIIDAVRGSTLCSTREHAELRSVAPSDLAWGYLRGRSRAHTFSSSATTFSPRWYPLSPSAIAAGDRRYFCTSLPPFFDLVNHGETNVEFVDVAGHAVLEPKNRCLVIQSRVSIRRGEELVMRYRCSPEGVRNITLPDVTVDADVGKLKAFLRFGFVPS